MYILCKEDEAYGRLDSTIRRKSLIPNYIYHYNLKDYVGNTGFYKLYVCQLDFVIKRFILTYIRLHRTRRFWSRVQVLLKSPASPPGCSFISIRCCYVRHLYRASGAGQYTSIGTSYAGSTHCRICYGIKGKPSDIERQCNVSERSRRMKNFGYP